MSDDSSDETIWELGKFATREAYLLRSFLTYLCDWTDPNIMLGESLNLRNGVFPE